MQRANKCDTNHIPKATAYSLVLREVLRRCGREVPHVGEERTCNAQQCREGCQLHRRAGRLASTFGSFLTQRPSAPPELRRAPAEIPEAPLRARVARLDLMAKVIYSQGRHNRSAGPCRLAGAECLLSSGGVDPARDRRAEQTKLRPHCRRGAARTAMLR